MQKRFERSNFLIIFKFVILGSIKAETETKKLFPIAMYELDWFLQNSLEKQ
jgi:phosphoribosyl-dephospho-CoA transferase